MNTVQKKIDAEIDKNIEEAESKELNLTAHQIVLATYISIFTKTVDDLIEESGHEALMKKIPTEKLMDIFQLFGNVCEVKEVYKGFKKLCPEVMPSANIVKLLYLRYPFVRGMKIARLYFGTSDQKLVTGVSKLKPQE